MNFYNDNDWKVCTWLRELIKTGELPAGTVDERSIHDIEPGDLERFTQVHLFAGIGGWPLALRLAGWPEDRPVWTGSCPCQPFSLAGKKKGETDKRHLWPEFRRLIEQCKPPVILGEQVASPAGRKWLARVRTDLEALGYAVGAADLCAAGAGAPQIRQRLFWVAYTLCKRLEERRDIEASLTTDLLAPNRCAVDGLADNDSIRQQQQEGCEPNKRGRTGDGCETHRLADMQNANGGGQSEHGSETHASIGRCSDAHRLGDSDIRRRKAGMQSIGEIQEPNEGSGWSTYRIIRLRDDSYRRVPVEPAFFPLAHGIPERVVRLRGYGNAIIPILAASFIQAAEEAICEV